ncbi:MAG: hypothetical protein AAGB48_04035 [Planctomycetota bacterium]
MPEHRIERSSQDDDHDDGILGLEPEAPSTPHPALSRTPPRPDPSLPPKPCPECGYDIRGLRVPVCPECGYKIGLSPVRDRDAVPKQSSWFDAKAAVYAGIGLSIGAVTYAIAFDPLLGPMAFGIDFVATVVVGWVVFFLCSMMWIGFDQPLRMTAVQLIGAYGAFAGTWALLSQIPFFGFIAFIVSGFVLVGLLADLLEIEYKDAFIVAVLSAVMKIILGTWVFSQFSGGTP